MSASLAQKRRAEVAWAVAAAVLAALLAALALGSVAGRFEPPESPGLAAPDYAARRDTAERIRIVTREGGYELTRGQDGRWSMRERGGYPVRPEIVAAFERGLSELRFGRAMTRDPDKHARLGLVDPEEGGTGVRVQVLDVRGALLANVVIGVTTEGAFARRATEAQTWTALGELPPLSSASAWLNMTPVSIDPARVARVDLAPPAGPPFAVLRVTPQDAGFLVGAPFSRFPLRSAEALQATAGALGAIEPLDVAPAPAIPGAPRARAVMRTFDGLAIDGELYGQSGRWWVKLTARAERAERAAEASAINRRAGPWAFEISQEAARTIAPPLDGLVLRPRAAVSAEQP